MFGGKKARARLLFELGVEFFVISFSFVLAYVLKKHVIVGELRGLSTVPNYYGVLTILLISAYFVIVNRYIGVYNVIANSLRKPQIISQGVISVAIAILLLYVFKIDGVSRILMGIYCLIYFITKICVFQTLNHLSVVNSDLMRRHYIAVGGKKHLKKTKKFITSDFGDSVRISYVETTLFDRLNVNVQIDVRKQSQLIKTLKALLIKDVVDGVILPLSISELRIGRIIINLCERVGVSIYFIGGSDIITSGYLTNVGAFSGCILIGIETIANSPKQIVKRIFDVVMALILLIIFLPIMIITAVAIKIVSPEGPIFFSQERVGLNRRIFKCYKFRTMAPDAESKLCEILDKNEMDGPAFKMRADPRIIPIVGKFMRRIGMDELPQLINVLRGEMSLVGPRPPIPDEVNKYPLRYHKRLSVKPGITCIWQCMKNRNDIKFDDWMKLDHRYIDEWSLLLDIRILLRTIKVVLTAQGR